MNMPSGFMEPDTSDEAYAMYRIEKDLTTISKVIGARAAENGWHDRWNSLPSDNTESQTEHVISKLALISCEVAEAIEELRDGKWSPYVKNGKPEGLPIELADVIIRALDLAHLLNIDIGDMVAWKLGFNATRGAMHGGKTI